MITITLRQLSALNACSGERRQFEKTFGKEATLTQANLRKALVEGLDVIWLLKRSRQFHRPLDKINPNWEDELRAQNARLIDYCLGHVITHRQHMNKMAGNVVALLREAGIDVPTH